MNTSFRLTITLLAVLTAAACATTATTPRPLPEELRMFVDPRVSYVATVPPRLDRRFAEGWSMIASGRLDEANARFSELAQRNPEYAPAALAPAVVAMARGDRDAAAAIVERVRRNFPGYAAADAYAAEIAMARGDLETAFRTYEKISDAGFASRREELRLQLFDRRVAEATAATDPATAIARLREALQLRSDATAVRMQLVNRLISMRQFDEARTEADPLLRTSLADSDELQVALAEISFGKGRYEEAIAAYDRLARRNAAYAPRLEEIKNRWAAANMPIQYRRAVEVPSITRADLAVLMFWDVNAVRFAQNVAEPRIAVDIANVVGRDELVRAIALGLVQVDQVTRQVDPYRQVTGSAFLRVASRLLTLRGTPSCAAGAGGDPERILTACGVPVGGIAASPDSPVSGPAASAALRAIDSIVSSAK
jgi:tetratricopeptide (TPR) repeat protein